jgi:hypothetical protein
MHTETIDHPSHYQTAAGIEAIDVMEGYNLGPHLFIAMKHLLRAGKKGDMLEDLGKARWYVARSLEWGVGFWHEEIEYYDPREYAKTLPPHVIIEAFGITRTAHVMAVQSILARALEAVEDFDAGYEHEVSDVVMIQAALGFIDEAIAGIERERNP